MKTEVIKLKFADALHISRGIDELDRTATTYGSDALKSAIFSVGISWYPEWQENNARDFYEGFRVSSAFPYCGEEYFLPKPAGMRFDFGPDSELTEAKQAKKITYVSWDVLKNWMRDSERKIPVEADQTGGGAFLFSRKEARDFQRIDVQQRVSVPVDGGDTKPFYFERIHFAEDSGLYFLIRFADESLREKIHHIVSVLGDTGIGTDRTVGNGQFTPEFAGDIALPADGARGLKMALGLYLPSKEELEAINLDESTWSLIRRGGYMAGSHNHEFHSLRKKNIYFFTEGSQFRTNQNLKGRYVDLQPEWDKPEMHPVWRCGMPLFINL